MQALRGNAAMAAEIRPPVGLCTAGDAAAQVSENAGGLVSAGVASTAIATAVPGPAALKGVITAAQIKKYRAGEVVRLAKGALLTPLAIDFIREKNLVVASDEGAPVKRINAGPEVALGALPLLWWIDGQCSSVAKVIDGVRSHVLVSRERPASANLKSVVKELAALIRNRKVSGGVLFVSSAARAALYANRCSSLRAVVATSEKSVSEGIEQLGANVLVIEYPQFGARAMSGFVQPFLESARAQPVVVGRDLDELRMCG